MADFQAELPLYERSGALATFLVNYRGQETTHGLSEKSFKTIVERVEALAVMMYEHGILEVADVELTQAWLQDLLAVGYVPPVSGQNKTSMEDGDNQGPQFKIAEDEKWVEDDGNREIGFGTPDVPQKLLVVAIPSIRADRRAKIRETWLSWGDDRIALRFFTEPSENELSNISISNEIETFGDLVILDIQQGMNFGLKLLEAMRWMSKHFVFDFFLRLDDDYFLCLNRLLKELDDTLLAVFPQPVPPIYIGSLHCKPGKSRMDEAYLLVSRSLLDRVLNAGGLLCGGHGGVTAGYWFTSGNIANDAGDVLWLHDPRLAVYEDCKYCQALENHDVNNSVSGATSVCEDHIGIHHSFPERVDLLWPAARDGENTTTSGSIEPLFDFMDDSRCPDLVQDGVTWQSLKGDNAHECSNFHAKGGVHYGAEGPPGNP